MYMYIFIRVNSVFTSSVVIKFVCVFGSCIQHVIFFIFDIHCNNIPMPKSGYRDNISMLDPRKMNQYNRSVMAVHFLPR